MASRAQETENHAGLSPLWHWWPSQGNPPETLPLTALCSHCSLVMEPTIHFLIPKGEARPPSSLIQTKSQRDISETLLLPPTSFNIYPPGNRLPLLWAVPTCDLELRVVAPGRVNIQRNQEPRRGWICILELPRGVTYNSPNEGVSTDPLSQSSPWGATFKVITSSPTALAQVTQK